MKQQLMASAAGLMLLSSGYDWSGKTLLGGARLAQPKLANKKTAPEEPIASEKNIHDQWQGKSHPNFEHGGFFARGDFLYWRADEEALEYGYLIEADLTEGGGSTSRQMSPKIKWDPGFRVAVGYRFAKKDYWELTATWTHFRTEQSEKKSTSTKNFEESPIRLVIPTWGASLLGSVANRSSVKWNLNYSIYDLDLGRNYFVSKAVAVEPFVGLRGAVIDQHYQAHYTTISSSFIEIPVSFRGRNDFWGIGAHVGTSLQWYCTKSFSLIGRAAGSLLYGDFQIKQVSTTITDPNGMTILTRTKDNETTASTNLEAMLGIQWEMFFSENKRRLSLALGYEWNQWFSQNRLIEGNVTITTSSIIPAPIFDQQKGDLSLQGATFQARFDF